MAVTATSATRNTVSLLPKSESQMLCLLMAHEMWWKEKGGATGLQRSDPSPSLWESGRVATTALRHCTDVMHLSVGDVAGM